MSKPNGFNPSVRLWRTRRRKYLFLSLNHTPNTERDHDTLDPDENVHRMLRSAWIPIAPELIPALQISSGGHSRSYVNGHAIVNAARQCRITDMNIPYGLMNKINGTYILS